MIGAIRSSVSISINEQAEFEVIGVVHVCDIIIDSYITIYVVCQLVVASRSMQNSSFYTNYNYIR